MSLVVTRKAGEGIVLRSSSVTIRVRLVRVKNSHQALIAIDAPEQVEIIRDELVDSWRGRRAS